MEQKRLCPFCIGELPPAATVCPHCGKILEGCNPAGCLPVGTVLAGRYTVGEMRSLDGEGVLYSGVENLGGFRVTIKEYLPVTLSAERGADCVLRPKQGSEVLFKTTRMDFADLYRAIQRITPASGLEAVLDVVEANNTVYAVMENLGGTPLDQWLEAQGWQVTYLPVDADGFVTAQQVENALRPDTVLVSVMAANNEIGTLEPVAEIGALCHERGVLFHTDAVQAVGAIPLDVEALHADMLSLSAHKFHGPKGIGALYIRKGVKIDPLIHGGAQERGHRAGTENLPGIVGLGKAIELAEEGLAENAARMTFLRNRLVSGLTAAIPDMRINGTMDKRLPNNVNVSFAGIEGEAVLLRLDLEGIAASSGSACTAGSLDPSHVLTAIGLTRDEAKGSLRLTLGTDTTQADVDEVVKKLPGIVASLREMTSWCGRG